MLPVSAPNLSALAARRLVPRDFLWLVARNRTTGAPQTAGFWSDSGPYTAQVINPDTGLATSRSFLGSGTLIKISPIARTSSITVQNVTIDVSQINDAITQMTRGYDLKGGRVEIHQGYFDPDTKLIVAAARCLFVGFVDKIEIPTPKEGEEADTVITCVSHTQELTRSNTAKRSHVDQNLRNANDNCLDYAAVVDDWDIKWGKAKKAKSKKFLGLF